MTRIEFHQEPAVIKGGQGDRKTGKEDAPRLPTHGEGPTKQSDAQVNTGSIGEGKGSQSSDHQGIGTPHQHVQSQGELLEVSQTASTSGDATGKDNPVPEKSHVQPGPVGKLNDSVFLYSLDAALGMQVKMIMCK